MFVTKLDALDPFLEVDAERARVGDVGDGAGLGEILCRAREPVNSLKESTVVPPSPIVLLGRISGLKRVVLQLSFPHELRTLRIMLMACWKVMELSSRFDR